jgi:hypothetical protein
VFFEVNGENQMRPFLPFRSTLLCLCLIAVSTSIQARGIRVDMAGADNFDFSGEDWAFDNAVAGDLAGDSFVSGAIPFQLNFGAGAADYSFCFTENGFVSFVQSPGCNSLVPPTGDFIAPFANDLTIESALWSGGLLDPVGPPYSRDEDTEALRFNWQATDTSGAQLVAQLVLLNRGAGNFDFEINYGPAFVADYVTSNAGGQGWSLGANTQALATGAFAQATNYFFSMVNGVLTGGGPPDPPDPPTPVDEPSMLLLLSLAALTLLAVCARGAKRRAQHTGRSSARLS